jgi:signal peptidase I
MENLNQYLYIGAAILTVIQAILWFIFPKVRKDPAHAGTIETIDSLWVAMVVALSLKAVLVQPFTIPSGSMEDTLEIGDYILVNKFEYGYSLLNATERFLEFKKPQRHDIVVFVFPLDHSKDYIKRCIGVPGDIIQGKNKVLYVNGVKQDEPFIIHSDPQTYPEGDYMGGKRDTFGPVTVQEGHYFMMGDNRDNSYDSRYWGQLDEKLVKGKAWMIYWHSVNFHPDFSRMFHFVK